MKQLLLILVIGLTTLPLRTAAAENRPDVLFFAVDDMNDWISLLDPKSPIKTPNLERLASRGMLFTRAYCICLLYTSPSPRDAHESRMPSSA